jgi:hypothetical protein
MNLKMNHKDSASRNAFSSRLKAPAVVQRVENEHDTPNRHKGAKQPHRGEMADKGPKFHPHAYIGTTSGGGVENAGAHSSAGKKFKAKSKVSQTEANRPNELESYAGSSGSGSADNNAGYGRGKK